MHQFQSLLWLLGSWNIQEIFGNTQGVPNQYVVKCCVNTIYTFACLWMTNARSRGSWISFLESLDRLEGFKTGCRSPLSCSRRLSHLSRLPCLSSNWAMLMRNSAILKEKNYMFYQYAIRSNIGGNATFPYVVCVNCLSPKQNENSI